MPALQLSVSGRARLRRAACAAEHGLPSLCAKQAFLPVSHQTQPATSPLGAQARCLCSVHGGRDSVEPWGLARFCRASPYQAWRD